MRLGNNKKRFVSLCIVVKLVFEDRKVTTTRRLFLGSPCFIQKLFVSLSVSNDKKFEKTNFKQKSKKMKTKLTTFTTALLVLAPLFAMAQEKKLWDFPVRPGMEEWNLLRTEQERVAAIQIPEDILAKLTPEELIHLCLTFPSFGLFTAFNTPQEGFSVMTNRYNIFQHLLSRNDVGAPLIQAYKDAGMTGFRTLPYSNEFWNLKLYYIELLLSQREILLSLTSEEKLELITEARLKFDEKINDENFLSYPGILFSVRIMAGTLSIEHSEFTTLQSRQTTARFIETGVLDDTTVVDEIISITDSHINAKKRTQ